MAYKKFNRAAYDRCDWAAKDIISRWLNAKGFYTLAEEKQDADVKAVDISLDPKNGEHEIYEIVFYEGEIKSGWVGDWPESFVDVHIPQRKAKLLQKHKGFRLKFWVISGDFKKAWEIDSMFINDKYLKEVPNTRYSSGEYFFCIPLEHCKLIDLGDL